MENFILRILRCWGFSACSLSGRFHPKTDRLIFRVQADGRALLLKGIPDTMPEAVITGNTTAHLYLGNRLQLAPMLILLPGGAPYLYAEGFWFYLMEFIDGCPMTETPEDELALGILAKRLHACADYTYPSALNADKSRFYAWFPEKPFKPEFDALLDRLPDFSGLDRCLIHSDLGPHNAMRRADGTPVLIDLDDAGIGSRHLDLGWAFIMQFVDFDRAAGAMHYRFDLAEAFLHGYYGDVPARTEYDLIWHGAVFMHMSYMQTYGPGAVSDLWRILQFGLAQKEPLWRKLCAATPQTVSTEVYTE